MADKKNAKRNNNRNNDEDYNPKFRKVKKINGNSSRCVWLKLDNGIEVDSNGFLKLSEDEQEGLPFN